MPTLSVIRKTHSSEAVGKSTEGMEFILSDATVDRYGDTIDPNGWVLDNFKKNPIALFNHSSHSPIGKWADLKVKDSALRGYLQLAPKGSSPRIDELHALIDAGILKAVSVGFIPLSSTAIKDEHGYYIGESFVKQELIETSLVSVPANPNALSVAKALRISGDTMDAVFGEHAVRSFNCAADGGTTLWRGQRIPIRRTLVGEWRGEKVYDQE